MPKTSPGIFKSFANFVRRVLDGARWTIHLWRGDDLTLEDGARINFEGIGGNTYIARGAAGQMWLVVDGANSFRATGANAIFYFVPIPANDNLIDLATAGNRFRNIRAGTEVGQHNGTVFNNSLDNVGLKLGQLQASVFHSGDFIQAGVDGSHAFMCPNMTTVEMNALAAVNGMIVYDTTANTFMKHQGGAWVAFGV